MTKTLKPQSPMSERAEKYAVTALKLTRDVQRRSRVELDVPYGGVDEQRLDIYLPNGRASEPVPVVLFMHGGGWTHGYKEWAGFMAPAITCLPAILVSVGYRLAPKAKYPVPVEDCRRALQWVHAHIGHYGGDPYRLYVGGHSAGGHLAALLALQPEALEEYSVPDEVVRGCFPVSGVFDLCSRNPDMVGRFLSSQDEAATASPIQHVAGNRVPFFITIGEKDEPSLRSQCQAMASALRLERGPVTVMDLKECDHFQVHLRGGDIDGPWATTVRRWMGTPPMGAS